MEDSFLKKSSILYEGDRNKIQQIWSMQKEIKDQLEQGKIKDKCILLVGDTNVGKTTLLYYLSGMKLKLQENPVKKTKQMKAIEVYENAIICNTLSTTQIPNVFTIQQGSQDVSLIDMPGMNDNRFLSLISNIFTFEQVFQKIDAIKQIHIAFVISQEMFDAQDIKENIREFTEHFNIEHFETSKNISLIFTKTEDDLDSIKETFFEHLEAIKEDIQDEEEQNIARFIDILSILNQQEDLAYCFPGQEPDQEEGEKITESIVERDCFIENDKVSLLNIRFVENIMESSKLKLPAFENNFNEILNQLHRTIENSLLMAVELIKCIHRKFVSSLFESQEDFQSFKETFCQSYLKLISSFNNKQRNKGSFTTEALVDIMTGICEKLTQEQYLYEIDRSLKQALNHEAQDELLSGQEKSKSSFLIYFSRKIGEIFNKFQKNLGQIEHTEMLIESIRNMGQFYQWISNSWFQAILKIQSLPKISDKLAEISEDLSKLQNSLWKQLSENTVYFQVFNSFSEKQVDEGESGQEESDGQPEKVVKTVGLTLNQLMEKYTKPKYLQKVQLPSSSLPQQKLNEDKVTQIVRQLEQKILLFSENIQSFTNENKPLFTDEQISLFFFEKKHLRHKIFLESALKNFLDYLKFFLYMFNVERSRRRDHMKVVRFLEGFIENVCQVLEQYLLYEQQIFMYLFMNNFEKATNAMNRGLQKVKISQNFIIKELIKTLIELFQRGKNMTAFRRQQITQMIVKSYNYLIAEFSDSRSKQEAFEKEMQQKLEQLVKNPEELETGQSDHQIKLNYFILETKTLSVKNILDKVNLFEQNHANKNIYSAYKQLFPRQKALAKPQKTPSGMESLQSIFRLTPAPK